MPVSIINVPSYQGLSVQLTRESDSTMMVEMYGFVLLSLPHNGYVC